MTEQAETVDGGRAAERRTVLTAFAFYLLAGSLHAALDLISKIQTVHASFLRLGWWLNEWRAFPFPFDLKEYTSQPLGGEFGLLFIPMIVTTILTLSIAVAALHSLTFATVVLTHAWFGWPKYWKDVRSRLDLRSVWARSAKRSWWIWPVTQFVWLLLDQIGWGYRYASYPIIDNDPPFLVANIIAACLMFGMISARILRGSVIAAVGGDESRCLDCGYLLRGLTHDRCPECGSAVNGEGNKEYGLFRLRCLRPLRKTKRRFAFALIVALLLAPVWLPVSLVNLPRTWLRYMPAAIAPDWEIVNRNPNAFPIRLDAVCLIRHDNSVAVIRFKQGMVLRADYEVAFWLDKRDMESNSTPDSFESGQVKNGGGPTLRVGPWDFTYGMASENMIWLTRPDSTYDVAAFTKGGLPEELRLVVKKWDKHEP